MSVSLLPDGTVGNPENVTKTDIDAAYIKAQSKIFYDFINDLYKTMEENTSKRLERYHQYSMK